MQPTSLDARVSELDADDFLDLIEAAQSVLRFSDNPLDDEEWRADQ